MKNIILILTAVLMLVVPIQTVAAEESAFFTVSFSDVKDHIIHMTVNLSGGDNAAGIHLRAIYEDGIIPVENSLKSSLSKVELKNIPDFNSIILLWDTDKLDSQLDGSILQARFKVPEDFDTVQIQLFVSEFYTSGADLPDIPYKIIYDSSGTPHPASDENSDISLYLIIISVLAAGAAILMIVFRKRIVCKFRKFIFKRIHKTGIHNEVKV